MKRIPRKLKKKIKQRRNQILIGMYSSFIEYMNERIYYMNNPDKTPLALFIKDVKENNNGK
jgi:hypothetical protein